MSLFGFYNINKPAGPTSHDIVAGVRRMVGRRAKVGHAGTLDPFATGVLIVCVGPATRLADYVQASPKRYAAEITLGATSTTDDIEGELTVIQDGGTPTEDDIRAGMALQVGTILQRPPAFSAIHVDGQRAYKKARKGEAIDVPPREVTIHSLSLVEYAWPKLRIDVCCGAGTYIRAIARDLGEALGVGGYCSELTRTAVGEFTIDRAVSPDRIRAEEDIASPLTAVAHLPHMTMPDEALDDLLVGKAIAIERFTNGSHGDADEVAIVGAAGSLLALGRPSLDGQFIRPRKVFVKRDS
jgi:tRNA pseudouridine55 synthase